MSEIDFVLQKLGVGPRLRQDRSADAHIAVRPVFVGVTEREQTAARILMADARGLKPVPHRARDIFAHRPLQRLREYNGCNILLVAVGSQQKIGIGPELQWAGERSLVESSLFRRLGSGEGLTRIEDGIAEQEVERTVVLWRSADCRDLYPSTPRPREFGRVGVLIDLYLLNRGRSHAQPIGLHTVHHQGHTTGRNVALAKEA